MSGLAYDMKAPAADFSGPSTERRLEQVEDYLRRWDGSMRYNLERMGNMAGREEMEELRGELEQALAKAAQALASAMAAQKEAEEALELAATAAGTADSALAGVEQASAAAEQASTVAEQASTAAEQASTVAEQASTAAEQASTVAEQASTVAEQASTAAEQAASSTAQHAADTQNPHQVSREQLGALGQEDLNWTALGSWGNGEELQEDMKQWRELRFVCDYRSDGGLSAVSVMDVDTAILSQDSDSYFGQLYSVTVNFKLRINAYRALTYECRYGGNDISTWTIYAYGR